jgi:hypothetical protein
VNTWKHLHRQKVEGFPEFAKACNQKPQPFYGAGGFISAEKPDLIKAEPKDREERPQHMVVAWDCMKQASQVTFSPELPVKKM